MPRSALTLLTVRSEMPSFLHSSITTFDGFAPFINNLYISPEQFKNNFSAELRQNIPQQEVKYIESNDSKGGDNDE